VLPSRSEETLVVLFVKVATFLIAQAVIEYARRRILARFGAQFQERMEDLLFAHAEPGRLFDRTGAKPLTGLDEVDGLRGFFHSASLVAIFDFFWAPMFLLAVFLLLPLLGWVCVAGIALVLVLVMIRIFLIGTRATDAAAARRDLGDMMTLIAASREPSAVRRWAGASPAAGLPSAATAATGPSRSRTGRSGSKPCPNPASSWRATAFWRSAPG
jgi:ABC-type protease/lipase transport system fused ATPase/permease subunit